MSASQQRRYRFASAAQWAAGLLVGVDSEAIDIAGTRPYLPYGASPQKLASNGAWAPAAGKDGNIYWRDTGGALHRLEAGDEQPAVLPSPAIPNAVRRMAAGLDNLWLCAGTPAELRCHDAIHLARRFTVAQDDATVIDFAADGRDGVWTLSQTNAGRCTYSHQDCAGYADDSITLPQSAGQITWLATSKRLVLLEDDGKRLSCYTPPSAEPTRTMEVAALRPGFSATILGSDTRQRILLAGQDATGPLVLTLDADLLPLHALPLTEAATGIHATAEALLVTTATGLLRYTLDSAAGGGVESSCTFITPVLQSPVTENPRRWLRAEMLVTLPPGASLEISYTSTADLQLQDDARNIIDDDSRTNTDRMAALLELLPEWQTPMIFRGDGGTEPVTLAAPLFETQQQWLLLRVTLVAAPGAPLPQLHRLDVLYPGQSLMEYLPQIYQRTEFEPGDFLRALVGVIETGTQEQDQRIGAMAGLIAPESAPHDWMDYVARWLDLPWDDALDATQKRSLLAAAAAITAQRGTRAGLEALLQALLPGTPPRYRVTDIGAQYGFAALGGSALPAVLAGLPSSALALNRKAILGKGRLTCTSAPPDDISQLTGKLTLHLTATASERAAWEPWLACLIGEVLPITVRLRLRWHSVAGRHLDDRLGDDFVLDEITAPRLNTDAVTGLARLGAGPGLRLR